MSIYTLVLRTNSHFFFSDSLPIHLFFMFFITKAGQKGEELRSNKDEAPHDTQAGSIVAQQQQHVINTQQRGGYAFCVAASRPTLVLSS